MPRSERFGYLSRAYLVFLCVLAAVWMVLAAICWFFPIASAVGMTTLGVGLLLFLAGYFWIMGLAVSDGHWYWLFPIPLVRGSWIVRYARENPERAARPFSLAMLGAVLFLLTFALFLLKQRLGLP